MLTEEMLRIIEAAQLAFVASADETGCPHLAAGRDVKVGDGDQVVFENWFCPTTLRNVALNPRVAVAVTAGDSGTGYQFIGRVIRTSDAAIMDGYDPKFEALGIPQTLTRLVVQVERVFAFSAGVHTDLPL